MEQIYTLLCSFTLLIFYSWMFNVINSSKMSSFKTIQEFSRTPEHFQGQQDVFQGSRTKQVLTANSRTILGAQGRLVTLQLHQKHAKPFWGARATDLLWSRLHCWTLDWAAKSTAVESYSILSGCPDSGIKSLWSVSAGEKSSFSFSNTYRCEAIFQRYDYFLNQAPKPTSTRRRHQVMCVDDHKPLFRQTGETNSETRFSLKFVNVDDEPNLLKLVFVPFS